MKVAFCRISDCKLTACCLAGVMFLGAASSFGGNADALRNATAGDAGRSSPAREAGIASYYGDKYHGKPTASGEIFDMHQLTAAHPRYAFGTRVKVTHSGNNRSVIVRINDRGPFVKGRVIDLSLAAARELRMVKSGLAEVRIEVINQTAPDFGSPSSQQ